MLKELSVGDITYFYDCNVKGDVIEYLLYDSNETWIATKTKDEVLQTVQLLNKRIKHDVAIAFDTLQNTLPDSATWVENDKPPEASNARERALKLKYRVKGFPFHFEWRLKQHNDSSTIQLPINQVASLVDVLPATIEELLGILQSKEQEINQYRREFGSLRRSTLATTKFDVETFREQYADADMNVKTLQRIVARWRSVHGEEESTAVVDSSPSSKGSPSIVIKKEEPGTSSTSVSKTVQESPRSRKRKALHNYKTQMMRSLQSAKKELEYESQSQSESQSLSDSEPIIGNEVKKVRENVEVLENVIAKEVTTAQSVVKSVNTPSGRVTRNSSPKTPANPIVADSNKSTKEVASNAKKSSPRIGNRPNTRQNRRVSPKSDSNTNELALKEATGESVLHAIVAPAKIATTTKTIIPNNNNLNVKHKIINSAKNSVKPQFAEQLEVTKNDLSTYVDSMLSQLAAIDKELCG